MPSERQGKFDAEDQKHAGSEILIRAVIGGMFAICSPLCSQNRALSFVVIYDNLGSQ